jgi:hypothetical protein
MRMLKHAVLAALLPAGFALGQDAPIAKGAVYKGAYTGLSFFTERGPRFALLRNRRVLMAGFRRERVFSAGSRFAWATTIEVPVSVIVPPEHPASAECWWRRTTGVWECYEVLSPETPVFAIGLTPLGIKGFAVASNRLRFFGSLAAGGVAFDRRTPVAKASALNFSAEYQLGADIGIGSTRVLEVAWKFQHWSNANMSHFNPGLDVNLITLGLRRRR